MRKVIIFTTICIILCIGCSNPVEEEVPLSYEEKYEKMLRGVWVGVDKQDSVKGKYIADTLTFIEEDNSTTRRFTREGAIYSDSEDQATLSGLGVWGVNYDSSALRLLWRLTVKAEVSGILLDEEEELDETSRTIRLENDTLFFKFESSRIQTLFCSKFIRIE